MKPIKPSINQPPTARTPNNTGPRNIISPVGNLSNPDKDYSKWSEVPPEQVNRLHSRDDADKSSFSHHHTLGPKRNQASPGDHIHDGVSSRKVGYGLGLTITGSKGSNVALTNLLAYLAKFFDFKDTTT